MSTFARVNEYGFIETPYRHVENGKVTKDISYLSALDERDYPIAQANAPLNSKGEFINKEAAVRIEGEAMRASVDEIRYMDVSPDQLELAYTFHTVGNYIAFSKKTSPHVIRLWQAVLDEMKSDGSYQRICRKYKYEPQ